MNWGRLHQLGSSSSYPEPMDPFFLSAFLLCKTKVVFCSLKPPQWKTKMQIVHQALKHGLRFKRKNFWIFSLFEFLWSYSLTKVIMKTLLQGVVLRFTLGIGGKEEERHKRKIFLSFEKAINFECAIEKDSTFFWKGIIISIKIGSS